MGKTIGTHWDNERINAASRINYFLGIMNQDRTSAQYAALTDDQRATLKARMNAEGNTIRKLGARSKAIGRWYNKTSASAEKRRDSGEITDEQYWEIDNGLWAFANMLRSNPDHSLPT